VTKKVPSKKPTGRTLVIVESPTKAKTIAKMLSRDFRVESSFGHIRDLPKSKMGIDIEHGFAPQYVVPKDKQQHVNELIAQTDGASRVILATDEDREGEAIAWHLAETLGLGTSKSAKPAERIVFHEITKRAIEEALAHPRTINQHMVDAQQARRVLDRLVGYELSPFLWRKVARGLSAGRVQSAALRLIVEREEEREAFKEQEYWTIESDMRVSDGEFKATLAAIDGKPLQKFSIGDKKHAEDVEASLKNGKSQVETVDKKSARRAPPPPFTTSTLQQESNRRLGFSAKQTMRLAQQLYEGIHLGPEGSVGLITYMRTDSVNLSQDFLSEAKAAIQAQFGNQYWEQSRTFTTKSKLAQEAHEAIRPSMAHRSPETLTPFLEPQQWKLYDLIWRRAVASQMAIAQVDQTSVKILTTASKATGRWHSNGAVIRFDGWLKLYPSHTKEGELPSLTVGETVTIAAMIPTQHFTQPPGRYSDASLVKALEEFGIGRPSTYAPTISTIVDRNYVARAEDKRFFPTDIGRLVTKVLKEHFPHIVDYTFTATMEDDLDAIAQGEKKWQPIIEAFYKPFHDNLLSKEDVVSKKELTEETSDEVCPKCSKPMLIKIGRFGKFLACSAYPECKTTKPLKGSAEEKEQEQEAKDAPGCPECGKPMAVKHGRFGPFYGCTGYPDCKGIKRIDKPTGVKCPKCKEGDVVARRSKRGKTFYGCNKYPDCDFVLWSKPVIDDGTKEAKLCPKCKSIMIMGAKNTVRCSDKECGYSEESTSDD